MKKSLKNRKFNLRKLWINLGIFTFVAAVIGVFTYYIVKMETNKVVPVAAKKNLKEQKTIEFNGYDKYQVIQRDKYLSYFLVDEFKSLFLRKLLDTKPEHKNFKLIYTFDDFRKPTVVKVDYVVPKLEKEIFWAYKIAF